MLSRTCAAAVSRDGQDRPDPCHTIRLTPGMVVREMFSQGLLAVNRSFCHPGLGKAGWVGL